MTLVNKNCPTIACVQDSHELYQLQRVLYAQSPATVIEIGTYLGGTLVTLCGAAARDALIISIDLPGGDFGGKGGGGYPEENIPIYFSWAKRGQTMRLLRNDSHAKVTQDTVKEVLGDKEVDFLLLDGDHTYEGVKRDFYDYLPFMNQRWGIIALHDICPHEEGGATNVEKFWKELKEKYEYTDEFVEDADKGWGGIGVVYL